MKTQKIIYYITTGLFTALMLFSAGMYFFKNADIVKGFTSFGYPTYIIYPLAIAKIFGLIAIWQTKYKTIKEWAYAGFFFNVILAFFAHYMIGDGEQAAASIGLVLIIASYYFWKKITNKQ
ncbi:DoxX family protein [Kordia sp. YSTF-M3]|uniref:DoxX family protein n=1 Tax=Kordia aestuariivivens TaxID=2759037 RepID=A0ABR7Q7K8_9FLAO|nr:DoxX family protein [Kordia aestuariivivens]MBC8754554.1 DoxX family protein [Kordia aestuariivivens]